jgi:hypothetical protein
MLDLIRLTNYKGLTDVLKMLNTTSSISISVNYNLEALPIELLKTFKIN